MTEKIFGLLGAHLSHSYSVQIHRKMGTDNYRLIELTEKDLPAFLKRDDIGGLNVTIPYKRSVMEYCDVISDEARDIGSVNTIVRSGDGMLHAYNTDKYGFEYMVRRAGISFSGKKILIMGGGGTSLTARCAAKALGAREIVVMCRRGPVTFDNIESHRDSEIIVNTTPVGMYPDNLKSLVSLKEFPNLSGVVDVVYNPHRTSLILEARELGIRHTDGLFMLVAQAKAAAELFHGKPLPESVCESITQELRCELENIVLIGMPGSGKTSIGAELEKLCGKRFADIDERIIERSGMSIPEIFAKKGEPFFRQLEAKEVRNAGKESGLIIGTGGGVVLDRENYAPLAQNGRIYHITRELELLDTAGRPLSANPEALINMLDKRLPLYESFRAVELPNSGTINDAAMRILEDFYENTCD